MHFCISFPILWNFSSFHAILYFFSWFNGIFHRLCVCLVLPLDPFFPPPISSEIEIRCFDLQTLTQMPHTYRAHKAYTSSEECFFIFIGVSEDFVASGVRPNSDKKNPFHLSDSRSIDWLIDWLRTVFRFCLFLQAENCKGYIWDRQHNITLCSLSHQSVVNCVAFNPADQQQLVTVSGEFICV